MAELPATAESRVTRSVPWVIYLHMFAAMAALAVGTAQLARAKGTGSHKRVGWIWVALMLTVAISSLWVPSFLHLTPIHVFTLLTLVGLPLALWRIRRGNVAAHARGMKALYFAGLVIAGIFTLSPGRLLGNLLWKGCWACA
jgi:uncharacterized membrane protein